MGGGIADCSPLPWDHSGFKCKQSIEIDGDVFNVYREGTEGIVVFCLHGAGYTGLTFTQFAVGFYIKTLE